MNDTTMTTALGMSAQQALEFQNIIDELGRKEAAYELRDRVVTPSRWK